MSCLTCSMTLLKILEEEEQVLRRIRGEAARSIKRPRRPGHSPRRRRILTRQTDFRVPHWTTIPGVLARLRRPPHLVGMQTTTTRTEMVSWRKIRRDNGIIFVTLCSIPEVVLREIWMCCFEKRPSFFVTKWRQNCLKTKKSNLSLLKFG